MRVFGKDTIKKHECSRMKDSFLSKVFSLQKVSPFFRLHLLHGQLKIVTSSVLRREERKKKNAPNELSRFCNENFELIFCETSETICSTSSPADKKYGSTLPTN